jgi:hypothetical protein
MTPAACPREAEVLVALEGSRQTHAGRTYAGKTHAGPSLSSGSLSEHLAECDVCAKLATARLIADVHSNDLEAANIPSAGQVWWRAQVRARAEARRAAERPMQIVQAVSAACVAGALAAGIGWAWPWVKQAAFWGAVPTELTFAWWLAIGAWLILAPVALYFVFARD